MAKRNLEFNPMILIILFFVLIVFGFVFRHFAFLLFMSVLLATLIGSIFFFIKYWKQGEKDRAFQNSMEGSIAQNLQLCEEQIVKNKNEMEDIRLNILELEQTLDNKMEINESTMNESEMLIHGFERELDLRKAKLDFYEICKVKIKNIQFNQQLAKKIATKKEKLKQLQEEHFEDLAEMEQLRSDMEYNKTFIDTINRLSLRMVESTSLSTAQELHDELREITDELRDL